MPADMAFLHCHLLNVPGKPSLFLTSPNCNAANNVPTKKTMSHQGKPMTRRPSTKLALPLPLQLIRNGLGHKRSSSLIVTAAAGGGGMPLPPLDLTEDNIRQVLADARLELGVIFDDSVGITGQAELVELDGPFVKISLKGRFWHKRSTVLARIGNYLKQRIPEILEVDIEDEKQLDDSPENF